MGTFPLCQWDGIGRNNNTGFIQSLRKVCVSDNLDCTMPIIDWTGVLAQHTCTQPGPPDLEVYMDGSMKNGMVGWGLYIRDKADLSSKLHVDQ